MLLGGAKSSGDSSAAAVSRPNEELTRQTQDFMAQFTKQATETIKNVVGVRHLSPLVALTSSSFKL